MIMSFGHIHGTPTKVQKVFDVRELSHDLSRSEFTEKFREIVEYGRAHPQETIGIGCEKGLHRSVALANKVATALRTSVYHRDKAMGGSKHR